MQSRLDFIKNMCIIIHILICIGVIIMKDKIKVGIIGATGYAGIELVRLLLAHKNVELTALSSVSFEGRPICEIYPSLNEICDMTLTDEDKVIESCDVVFTSLPSGLSEPLAEKCQKSGAKLIDLGADFRLKDENDYEKWYKLTYKNKDLHKNAVYCIPELHRASVSENTSVIGNPGCYPTSVGLGLAPLAKAGLIQKNSIVIDSKSGTTGAGRGLSQTTHFPDCNEAFSPYKVAEHRHTPEIEQTISELCGEPQCVTFVPHLLPISRGILSTIYLTPTKTISLDEIHSIYEAFYKNERFVRVLKKGSAANLKNVRMSNYCDISIHYDEHTNRIIIVSAIDNMVKGAAGQAIQNMNLLFKLNESEGLCIVPPAI